MDIDSIVEEIRRLREEHAVRFHHDLHAICEDFRAAQVSSGRAAVSRPPRKPIIAVVPQAARSSETATGSFPQTVG